MSDNSRICESLKDKIMSAGEAAELVLPNSVIGFSGFALIGDPKVLPKEIARQGKANHLTILTGSSSCDDLDGSLVRAGLVDRRYAYQDNKSLRAAINAGEVAYADISLGSLPEIIDRGEYPVDYAIIECAAVSEDGIVLTDAVGAADSFIRKADKLILEVNAALPIQLKGMHDICEPDGKPLMIMDVSDRIGTDVVPFDQNRVIAVVLTDEPGEFPVYQEPDETSQAIAENIIRFLEKEISEGRQPAHLNPLQSGVGNVANAVLAGLAKSSFSGLRMYTEVLQDSAMDLLMDGRMVGASTTAIVLSREMNEKYYSDIDSLKDKIVLRSQEISNHPEVIRRLNVISMNTPIEADIYGNVNSTHILGTDMMNGVGGSGDFARNAGLSIFATPSVAKDGRISCIVPFCSHIDHTEHDVKVIVTEQGLADLRWKSPKERAQLIIENCAHPKYRPELREYFKDACKKGGQTPHDLSKAFDMHQRYLNTGSM